MTMTTLDRLAVIRRAVHDAMWYAHQETDDRRKAYDAITSMIKEQSAQPVPIQNIIEVLPKSDSVVEPEADQDIKIPAKRGRKPKQ